VQDRPDKRELIEAVASFIEREIVPFIPEARLRFRSLVAANVLNIVARELAAGDIPLREEWQRLTSLLGRDEQPPDREADLRAEVLAFSRELCAQIRAGNADESPRYEQVFDHAEATVIEKLRVANPRYLERIGRGT
jgi:hypothetical protein